MIERDRQLRDLLLSGIRSDQPAEELDGLLSDIRDNFDTER